MRVWNVGVVGGGPGGLMTAYALQRLANCPYRLTLFEASSRLGGKILTPHFRTAPVRYEAGAAELYGYARFDDPLKELVAELGLPVQPIGGSAVIMDHRVLANLDDIRARLGPMATEALLAFDRRARDRMTPQAFYHSDFPDGAHRKPDPQRFDALLADVAEPEARHWIETLIHSDLATEPDRTSPNYGLQNYLMNDQDYMHLYGIEGGNERLPRELAARIEGTILLDHSARGLVGNGERRLRLTTAHADGTRRDDFDFVVLALPHDSLMSVDCGGDRLSSAMRRHHAYYDHPAHYLRISILFEKPFWKDLLTDSYWMLENFGGCCLYDESSRDPGSTYGVLGWLISGAAARRMSPRSNEQLIEDALGSLPSFLAHGRQAFLEGAVHRWVGAVSALPGGVMPQPLDRRHRPEPTDHPHLFVVGDYLFDSTLNGVLDSAEYVAAWIASLMDASSNGTP